MLLTGDNTMDYNNTVSNIDLDARISEITKNMMCDSGSTKETEILETMTLEIS